ncbi:helicase HerA domain-containing protein [Acaryochloris marina]|uniref:Helicase HerA central domain-containing protein n=1 Tax=Acaryochloris marina (strain MBIC 11017) TaxID=329726 RepID=A8ZPT0_ACAM1|nr:DUF87 domain-containing protein [Acaryochloris marina]ABW33047.1 hypothetical protein AM1_F0137 [Acaryochloris marina MBIC11017]
MSDNTIQYTPSLDKAPDRFFIPGQFLIPWIAIITGVAVLYLLVASVTPVSPWPFGLLLVVLIASHWIIVGDKPWKFGGSLHRPKEYVTAHAEYKTTSTSLKPKIGPKVVGGARKRKAFPIEDEVDLACMAIIRLQGYVVGAYLLQVGRRFRFVWVFDSPGLSSTLSVDQAKAAAQKLEEGLMDLPHAEQMTLHMGTMADCQERLNQLEDLKRRAPSDQFRFLLSWLKERVKSLTRRGQYNPKFLRFYVTYTVGVGMSQQDDQIQAVAQSLQEMWQEHMGSGGSNIYARTEQMLLDAFRHGFLPTLDFFEKVGLKVTPMTADQIWAFSYQRVNSGKVPPIPQWVQLDENGITWGKKSELRIASVLFGQGIFMDKRFVHLPGRNLYCGGVVLNKRPAREYDPDTGRLQQLMDASSPINAKKVSNTELIVEFTPDNQQDVLKSSQKRTGQSNLSLVMSQNRKKLDGGAIHNTNTDLAAEMKLRQGARVVRCAWMALIYRSTPDALDVALKRFRTNQSLFAGECLVRERGYFDQLWLEAQPYTWRTLLAGGGLLKISSFERRIRETTPAVLGITPVMLDRRPHKKGVELLTDNGTPLYVDPLASEPKHNHMIILGGTGSGKSFAVSACCEQVLAEGGQVLIIDATRGDGSGTYDELTTFLGGAYFNTTTDSFNLIEGTDFRQLLGNQDAYKSAQQTFRQFVQTALMDLCLPEDVNSEKRESVSRALTFLLDNFFKEPSILTRYNRAFDAGMGTPAWEQIPTLTTLTEYIDPSNVPPEVLTQDIIAAIDTLKVSLSALLRRPIGAIISRPTTFNTDANLVVYALGNIDNDEDMAPLALAAQASVLSRSLGQKPTLLVGEEGSKLHKFKSYRQMLGSFYSIGRKNGIWTIWVGTDLQVLAKADNAAEILANVGTYLVGAINEEEVPLLVKLGIPRELLIQNVDEEFIPSRKDACSKWLISSNGNHQFGRYHPSFANFGLTMNGPDEVPVKASYKAQCPHEPYRWVSELAHHLKSQSHDANH